MEFEFRTGKNLGPNTTKHSAWRTNDFDALSIYYKCNLIDKPFNIRLLDVNVTNFVLK